MTKIATLLPYKENYTHGGAGAVSLWVSSFLKYSKNIKDNIIFGSTSTKDYLSNNYFNIELENKSKFSSKTEIYSNELIKIFNKKKFDIIEIHNRPLVFFNLKKKIKTKYIFYFHNNPQEMRGSKSIKEREELLIKCDKIIFLSNWIKKKFFEDLNMAIGAKTEVVYPSVERIHKFPKKKRQIIFVGKLNKSKGYHLFGEAIIKILKKYENWKAISIGDEKRERPIFSHKNFKELGYLNHKKTLNHLKQSEIAIVPSIWEEPFGRTSLEGASCGCLTIISNKGGLPETSNEAIGINDINSKKIISLIDFYIKNPKKLKQKQIKSFKNTLHYVAVNSKKIDFIRDSILEKKFTINLIKSNLKIMNIYNFGQKLNHRIYNISLGKKFSNGFIRNGHDVLEISDRDFINSNKRAMFVKNNNVFQKFLIETFNNYNPNFIFFGHLDSIGLNTLSYFKKIKKDLKICQWNEDPLMDKGPNVENNISRINLYKDIVDLNFVTTHPSDVSSKLDKKKLLFLPIPVDKNIEKLNVYNENPSNDLFYAMSHGVNRGKLKAGKKDERIFFLKKLIKKIPNIRYDFYGLDDRQPIWSEKFYTVIRDSKMALNLSRGKTVKYYSSNRIASLIGNGLLTFIDRKTKYNDFFKSNEIVFYDNIEDLAKKIIYFTKNESKRKKYAENGQKKYFKLFNEKRVAEYIVNKTFNRKNNIIY